MSRHSISMGIILMLGYAVAKAQPQPTTISKERLVLQTVVHVNSISPVRHGHGLRNIANVLKQEPDAQIEVVCHSDGIKLVVEGESRHTEKVKELIGQGVRFIACENTMKEKKIPRDKLLPGVKTVSSGGCRSYQKTAGRFWLFQTLTQEGILLANHSSVMEFPTKVDSESVFAQLQFPDSSQWETVAASLFD